MDTELSSLIALLKRTLPLKELPRIGWIMEGARRDDADSVAAHSYIVVLLSLLLAKQLTKAYGPFDLAKVLSMATLHDLPECVTGDFDSGLKRRVAAKAHQRGIFEEIEQEALQSLVGDIADHASLTEVLKEFDAGATREAKLVKFADILEAFAHAKERLGKTFEQYLNDQKQRLALGSPECDAGLGLHLAGWIDQVIQGWDSTAGKSLA